MATRPLILRVLYFREPNTDGTWVAQVLEHDIAAFGDDIDQAKRALAKTVYGYVELAARQHREPLASIRPAPDFFWQIWEREAGSSVLTAEPIPSLPGHMLPAVTHEPVQTAH